MEFAEDRRKSYAWSWFTKKDAEQRVATCKLCHKDYSYKTTVTNLKMHLRQKHSETLGDNMFKQNSDSSDDEDDSYSVKRKASVTLKYFDVVDKFTATCKICDAEVNYESVADLTKHVESHDAKLSDDEQSEAEETKAKPSGHQPSVWKYFKRLEGEGKLANCLICKKRLSYFTTVTNLKKHLERKHPNISFDNDEKKILISSNGQIYEIAHSPKEDDENDDNAPMEMDTVYFEDIDESLTNFGNRETAKRKIRNREKDANQRKKYTKKPVQVDSSSEDEQCKTKKHKKTDPIDFFGDYVVSLLKELPKNIADQLQCDIIKQVIAAKLAHSNSEPNYTITVNPVINSSDINNVIAVTKLNNSGFTEMENMKNDD